MDATEWVVPRGYEDINGAQERIFGVHIEPLPDWRLAAALLAQAVSDLAQEAEWRRNGKYPAFWSDPVEWFSDPDVYPCSFRWCCAQLGVRPESVLSVLVEVREAGDGV